MKQVLGLHQRDFYTIFILKELAHVDDTPLSLFARFDERFSYKRNSQDYFYKIIRELHEDLAIVIAYADKDTHRAYFTVTSKGKSLHHAYVETYYERFVLLKKVAERFNYALTGTGEKGTSELVPKEDRRYFSSVVSVKDVIRYVILKEAQSYPAISMKQVLEHLHERFGWSCSRSYLYQLSREMEEQIEGALLTGTWEDDYLRTSKTYRITPLGKEFLPRLTQDTTDSVRNAQKLLAATVSFLSK